MRYFILVLSLMASTLLWSQDLGVVIRGAIENSDLGKKEGGVTVTVVQNGATIATTSSVSSGKFKLNLTVEKSQPFEVIYTKPGFVTKKMLINFSKLNEEDAPPGGDFFPPFDIGIFKKREGVDFSFLETSPVAKFDWDTRMLEPRLDRIDAGKIKAKIDELLSSAEDEKEELERKYNEAVAAADKFYDEKDYENALAKYEEALGYKPAEPYPAERIIELDALIQAQQEEELVQNQADEKYNNLIAAADNLRDQEKYEAAIEKYLDALDEKEDQYPEDQIARLKKLISDKQKAEAYDNAIELADSFYDQGSIKAARDKYEEALKLRPNEAYPKDQLAKLDAQMDEVAEAEELQKKYEAAIADADKLFDAENYEAAKTKYEEALTYESSATYPKGRIELCDEKLNEAKAEQEHLEQIQALLDRGNEEIGNSDWETAKGTFTEVLGLDIENEEAIEKLALIEQKIEEAGDLVAQEEKYNALMIEGDQANAADDLANALAKYEEAQGVKDTEDVKAKIEEVKLKLADQEALAAQENEYNKLMDEAESMMGIIGDVEGAREKYVAASAIYPERELPKTKIAEIDDLLASQNEAKAKKEQYEAAIASADNLFNEAKWDEAKEKYREALVIDDTQEYPNTRLAEIDLKVEEEAANRVQADYEAAVSSADHHFNEGNWEEARAKYREALEFDGSQAYPNERLAEIDAKMAEEEAANEQLAAYNAAINSADALYNQDKLEDAKAKYEEAITLNGAEQYPQDRVKEITERLANAEAEAEKKAAYEAAITAADAAFTSESWEDAKAKYTEAISIDASKDYPSQRISEIDGILAANASESERLEQISTLMAEGKELYGQEKLVEARSKFQSVMNLDSSNDEASDAIQKINEELNALMDAEALEKEFKKLKQEGFDLADSKSYQEAINKLNEALAIKDDQESKDKIKEINEIMAADLAGQEKDEEYNRLIAEAQTSESAENYEAAIDSYKAALEVKPSEPVPVAKITELEAKIASLASQAEIDEEYQALMKKGDNLVAEKKYIEAIKEYNNALAIKPYEQEPVDKAAEAQRLAQAPTEADEQYEKILTVAEKKIEARDFERAIELLERAKVLRENDDRPDALLIQIADLKKIDAEYSALMSAGDNLAASNNFTEAKEKYEAALGKKPEEQEPVTKIALMDQKISDMASAEQKEELYKDFMMKGNTSEGAKSYEMALSHYQNALGVKPGDVTAQNKINEIQQILDDIKNSNEADLVLRAKFDAILKEADGLFAGEQYMPAKRKYQEALAVILGSAYAVTQIEACDRLEHERTEREVLKEYQKIITAADNNFADENWEKAIEYYNRALSIKGTDPYPKEKLKEIDNILHPKIDSSEELVDLGEVYGGSLEDALAELRKADEVRKGLKGIQINETYRGIRDEAALMTRDRTAQHYEASEQIYQVYQAISVDALDGDLNRQEVVRILRASEVKRSNDERANLLFELQENLADQGTLDQINYESAIDYNERESVYQDNAAILEEYNSAQAIVLADQVRSDYVSNIESNQEIADIYIAVGRGSQDNYDERVLVQGEVVRVRTDAMAEQGRLSTDNYSENIAGQAVVNGVYLAAQENATINAEIPRDNNVDLVEIRNDYVNEQAERAAIEEALAYRANAEIELVKIRAEADAMDFAANREASTEILKSYQTELADAGLVQYNAEMVKYMANDAAIREQVKVNGEIEILAEEAHAQKVADMKIIDKKIQVDNQSAYEGDLDQRMDTRRDIENALASAEQEAAAEELKLEENATEMSDLNRALNSANIASNILETESAYAAQEALNNIDNSPGKKVLVENELGAEYPEGVSQESFTKSDQNGLMTEVITRRIVVIDGHADVYVRTQTLHGITYSRNGNPSLSHVWNKETQDPSLERHY
ncbi:MAG: hypothetical protein QNK23_17815 [Crocinitomicaceae bacterium]|nr:hypothetical protein [Crocinitomicaceae bacterium]